MEEGFRLWANPSSPHAEGRKARSLLEDARERIKAALGWDGELIFASGASEAAVLGFRGLGFPDSRFVSAVEHDSVVQAASNVGTLAVGMNGDISDSALETERASFAIQHVNSETGNRMQLDRHTIGVHMLDGFVLSDCSQSAGKFPLPELPDVMLVAAHKFGGPIGIGAVLVRSFGMLEPSGGQERGYRRGTENLPGAMGMAVALEACGTCYLDQAVTAPLHEFADDVRAIGGEWISDRLADPTPYVRAIAMPRLSGSAQVMRFDMAGISVSQGSACSSGTMKPSRVLEAMGVERDVAERTIRVSFGWSTTRAEVERFCEVWLEMARA